MLDINKQAMKYALQGQTVTVYEKDEDGNPKFYETEDGEKIYYTHEETGFSEPVDFRANISFDGGEAQNKVKAIEYIDSRALKPMLEYLESCGDSFRILIMPDHPTPLETMTHSAEPVPFLIYDSRKAESGIKSFTEKNAAETGLFIEHGPDIMNRLLEK